MSVSLLLLAIALLGLIGFGLARRAALTSAGGNPRLLHSLPGYYGWHGALMTALPALAGLIIWLLVQPVLIERSVSGHFPADMIAADSSLELTMADVRRVAGGSMLP